MSYKLFIDDERLPVGGSWTIARSSLEAIAVVETRGLPEFISFDHDLGGRDISMLFVRWLIEYLLDSGQRFPDFYVHTQNPVGRDNLEGLIASFKRSREAR